MKLGIAVVYLVSEENEGLLDRHLHQIERHTEVPYTIYASTNRLLPCLRERLEAHPHIKICDCPATEQRNAQEHSYYLERLVEAAVEDGATHVVTLHVDSFPVATGWARTLAEKLTGPCVLATIDDAFTACLFFTREFYLNHRPPFLLSEEERATPAYQAYHRQYPHHLPHSGIGFLYKVFTTEGLSWHLLDSADNRIFGGMLYHFGSVVLQKIDQLKADDRSSKNRQALTVQAVKRLKKLRRFVPAKLEFMVARRGVAQHVRRVEMARLLDDFDGYMKTLNI